MSQAQQPVNFHTEIDDAVRDALSQWDATGTAHEVKDHADGGFVVVALVPARKVAVCPTRTPEVHELGEFPMSCYQCHVHADS